MSFVFTFLFFFISFYFTIISYCSLFFCHHLFSLFHFVIRIWWKDHKLNIVSFFINIFFFNTVSYLTLWLLCIYLFQTHLVHTFSMYFVQGALLRVELKPQQSEKKRKKMRRVRKSFCVLVIFFLTYQCYYGKQSTHHIDFFNSKIIYIKM